MDRYEPVRDLGSGNFGVAKLMRDRVNEELVAIKFIERGERVDRNVEREICNHRMLNHPNIVGFKEVFLTPSHLGIVMEYAAGGELFERIVRAGRFSEDEARYFFQQLISGVNYCHLSGVCHRDLKLENTLLDGNAAPRLKICDFGYSKSAFDSQPKSTVGTPAYIAPEVLQRREYNGQPADVWSCGVTLYVMLVGAYPFEDPADPRNFRKTIQRIMHVKFSFPANLHISPECQDLISRIFVADPVQRITISDIRRHPWFQRNLPAELANPENYTRNPEPHQSLEEIRDLISAARTRDTKSTSLPLEFNEDEYMDADITAASSTAGGGDGTAMGMALGLGLSGGAGAGAGGGMVAMGMGLTVGIPANYHQQQRQQHNQKQQQQQQDGSGGAASGAPTPAGLALGGTYLLDPAAVAAAAAAAGGGYGGCHTGNPAAAMVGLGPQALAHLHAGAGVGLGGMGGMAAVQVPMQVPVGMGMPHMAVMGVGSLMLQQEYGGGGAGGHPAYLAVGPRGGAGGGGGGGYPVAAAAAQQAGAYGVHPVAVAAAAAARSGGGGNVVYGGPQG